MGQLEIALITPNTIRLIREHGLELFFCHALTFTDKGVKCRFLVDKDFRIHFQGGGVFIVDDASTDSVVSKAGSSDKHVRTTFGTERVRSNGEVLGDLYSAFELYPHTTYHVTVLLDVIPKDTLSPFRRLVRRQQVLSLRHNRHPF